MSILLSHAAYVFLFLYIRSFSFLKRTFWPVLSARRYFLTYNVDILVRIFFIFFIKGGSFQNILFFLFLIPSAAVLLYR